MPTFDAGRIALAASPLSWRSVTGPFAEPVRSVGLKTWYNAWGSGITAWLPVLLLAGAAVVVLLPAYGLRVRAVPLLWLPAAITAIVLIVMRWVTLPEPDPGLLEAGGMAPDDVRTSAGIGLYLGLGAAALSAVGAVLGLRSDVARRTRTGG